MLSKPIGERGWLKGSRALPTIPSTSRMQLRGWRACLPRSFSNSTESCGTVGGTWATARDNFRRCGWCRSGNAAAYLLRAAFQRSALPAWRVAIDEKLPNKSEIALAALGEHAEAGDSVRLLANLEHPKARLRAMALRGLARTGSPDLASILKTALFDPSARVVEQAVRLIEHSGEAIDRSSLEAAYERASSARLRAVYVRAARLLAQWESLEVLLAWAGETDAETFLVVMQEIERWRRFQNRRFAPLPDDARAALMGRLTAVGARRPSRVWEGFEDVLRPL